ncbi:MAG: hypothetical protein V3V56_01520 [bacterium]
MSETENKRAGRGRDSGKRKRRKNKIEGAPGQEGVDKCLQEGGSLREACGILRDTAGYSVGTNAMARYARNLRAESAELRKLELLVAEIVESAEAPLGRDTAALARRLLLARALDAVRRLPDDSLEDISAERLSLFVSRLERTAAMVERVRLARTKAYDRARDDIFQRIEDELREHPELLMRLREVMEEIYEAAARKAEAHAETEGEKEDGEGELSQTGFPPLKQ